MKTLHFSIDIAAAAPKVWEAMLQPASYREWTAQFCPGSYYEGSWEPGARIRFLSPGGGGMHARIAEARAPEFLSIEHRGEIVGGVDQPDAAWAGAHENYTLAERGGTTRLQIDMDVMPEFEAFMQEAWPKALASLKAIAEGAERREPQPPGAPS